jgi:hypothetical protein
MGAAMRERRIPLEEFEQRRGDPPAVRGDKRVLGFPQPGQGYVTKPARGHAYASLTEGVVLIGLTAVLVLAESAQRRNLLIIRNSSPLVENIFVAFNTPATQATPLRLLPNQIVLFDTVVPQDDMWVISDTISGRVSYSYSTEPHAT